MLRKSQVFFVQRLHCAYNYNCFRIFDFCSKIVLQSAESAHRLARGCETRSLKDVGVALRHVECHAMLRFWQRTSVSRSARVALKVALRRPKERTMTSAGLSLNSTISLRDGNAMPVLGLGVYMAGAEGEAEQACTWALKHGYRLIDTAEEYE